MATSLRRVNDSDSPSSGVRWARRLQIAIVCKRHDFVGNRDTQFSWKTEFTLNPAKTNHLFLIPEVETATFYHFSPFLLFFGFRDIDWKKTFMSETRRCADGE